MDEILLRGAIESVHLHDGHLEVTMGGQVMAFAVSGEVPAAKTAQPPKPRQQRRTNGSSDAGADGQAGHHDGVVVSAS